MSIGNSFIGNLEKPLILDVLKSKKLFRYSKEDYFSYSFIFEKQIKEMYNSSGVIIFPSATLALFSFLKTYNFKEGSEVIISPFSWVADYSLLLFENLKIRFCYFDDNLQINVKSIEKLINEKTKIIIIPHLMGRGQQNIDKISKICKDKKIILIEDIAQAFGVKIKGKYAGSFGDFSYSSFNHHKLLSSGDGGVGIINCFKKYKEMCQIHDQGCFIDDFGKRKPTLKNYSKGLSLRVNNLTGALLLAQLANFPNIKYLILKKYNDFINLNPYKQKIIDINEGDIPYTALLKFKPKKDYPSLLESGLHYFENIPYFKKEDLDKIDLDNLKICKNNLKSVYAIGTGFIDKYYAIKEGFEINEDVNIKKIKEIID